MLTYDDADHRCRRQRRQRSVVAQRRRRERGAGRLQGQAWRAREVSEGEANGCTGLWTPARPLWGLGPRAPWNGNPARSAPGAAPQARKILRCKVLISDFPVFFAYRHR